MSLLPGNSLGSTWLPDFLNPAAVKPVGEGAGQVSWTNWLSDISNKGFALVNPLAAYMPSAVELGKTAGTETANFVKRVENKVLGAATGVGDSVTGFFGGLRDTVKYLAWGLVAITVLYVLAVFVLPVTSTLRKK